MQPDHFRTFAAYNAWANRRLYDACAGLPLEALAAPRPAAYFGSLLGTLNHLLVGDRFWLARFEGLPPPQLSLDQILFGALDPLRAAREAEDARILAYTERLSPEVLAGDLTYRRVNGQLMTTPLALALSHLFNHQTHHRGQAHALVKDAGLEPPSLDLIYFHHAEAGS